MSEPYLRSRRDIGGYDTRGQEPAPESEDPLAELARLVGKDDPFRAVPRGPESNVARFPQLNAPRPTAPHEDAEREDFHDFDRGHHPDFDAQLRGSLDTRNQGEASDNLRFAPQDAHVEAFEPALGYPEAEGRGEAPPLNADLWAEGALPQNGPSGDLFQEPAREAPSSASPRRTLVVLAAVLALTGGGIAATFLMRDGSSVRASGGTPPTIMASETPVKVQSPDMSAGANTDTNTALLEKSGSDKVDNAKVVANNEQPVDLNQLPKASATPDGDAAAQASSSPFPQPRKVKTVLVRPDGSVVGDAAPAQAPQQPIGMVLPTEAGGPAPAAPAAVEPPVAKPATPKSTARASTTPTAIAGGASGAKQIAAPTRSAKLAAVTAATPAATEASPAAAPGTWSVQLAAPPTEAEAKDTSARLQKKFSGELGGLKPSIVKADKNGAPVYRVRVGNLAQADAKALCAKLQGGGGSCFAVKN